MAKKKPLNLKLKSKKYSDEAYNSLIAGYHCLSNTWSYLRTGLTRQEREDIQEHLRKLVILINKTNERRKLFNQYVISTAYFND